MFATFAQANIRFSFIAMLFRVLKSYIIGVALERGDIGVKLSLYECR